MRKHWSATFTGNHDERLDAVRRRRHATDGASGKTPPPKKTKTPRPKKTEP